MGDLTSTFSPLSTFCGRNFQQSVGKIFRGSHVLSIPLGLIICSILCTLQLHYTTDSYIVNNLDQLLVCGPLGPARWKRKKCQELHPLPQNTPNPSPTPRILVITMTPHRKPRPWVFQSSADFSYRLHPWRIPKPPTPASTPIIRD